MRSEYIILAALHLFWLRIHVQIMPIISIVIYSLISQHTY